MGLRELLDKIFPTDDGRQKTNELVERGLQALRSARDEQSFTMGDVTRVPSRLELRLPQERFDALKAMEAARDLQFFFTDELIHHKTPAPRRKLLETGALKTVNDALSRVEIFDAKDLQPHSFEHDMTGYERDVSDDEDEDLGRAKGNTFDDPRKKRTFIRFWITVQPIGETIYW